MTEHLAKPAETLLATALAALEPPVFVGPAMRTGKAKFPTTPNGFYDYSADPAVIPELFLSRCGIGGPPYFGASGHARSHATLCP